MKTIKQFFFLTTTLLFITTSCKKQDLSIRKTIECPSLVESDKHPDNDRFQAILDEYVEKGLPSISAAILSPDGLWTGTAGLANIDEGLAANHCHTYFSGSVAKMYTVTAAMRLYEQGLLDLDAPISQYLKPEISNQLPNGRLATVRQLMNHSAGMPDHDNDEDLSNWIDDHDGGLPSPEAQLAFLYDDPPRFAPGDSAEYSSAHTVTLAMIIDSIAGDHSKVISQEIIEKLDLDYTFYKNEMGYPQPENLVNGYYGRAKKNNDYTKESINYCDGSHGDAGVIATALDYLNFIDGLSSGQIVSPSTWKEMINADLLFDDGVHGFGFGLGVFVVEYQDQVVKIGHGGLTLGGMTHLFYYPRKNSIIAICTNTSTEDEVDILQDWGANVLVNIGSKSVLEDFESIILK